MCLVVRLLGFGGRSKLASSGCAGDSKAVVCERRPLTVQTCLFVNLPETHNGRWGTGLTAADMKECIWLRPQLVAQIEYLEWTESDHLRHSKFAGLRDDKDARTIVKEHTGEG